MNNRRYQRIEVPNLVAEISDGVNCFSGTVINISLVGIQLDDLSKRLNDQAKLLSTTVSVNSRHFKIIVTPKWVSENNFRKKMGFQIFETCRAWTDLIRRHEPKDDAHQYKSKGFQHIR
ncbi:MAG: hypothetical protein ACI8PB_002530 [Desulforhopalus sp.]|jgi:hypothetical protein